MASRAERGAPHDHHYEQTTRPRPRDTGADRLDPAPQRLVGLALLAGVVLEIGLRGGVTNTVVAAGLFIVVGILVTDQQIHRREARLLSPWRRWSPQGSSPSGQALAGDLEHIVAGSGLMVAAVAFSALHAPAAGFGDEVRVEVGVGDGSEARLEGTEQAVVAIAAGEWDETATAAWLRAHLDPPRSA